MYTWLIDDLIDVYLVDITNCDAREDQVGEWSGAVRDWGEGVGLEVVISCVHLFINTSTSLIN